MAQDLPGAEVTEVELVGAEDLDGPLTYSCTITLRVWGRRVEKLLLFRVPWAEPALYQGPLAAGERAHALAAPLVQRTAERHRIELPPGFGGYGLPYERAAECPWAAYRCSHRIEDGRLVCERSLAFRGGIVPPEHFAEFRAFWETCTRSDSADVVLTQ